MTIYDADPAVGPDGFDRADSADPAAGGRVNSAADSTGMSRAAPERGDADEAFLGNPQPLLLPGQDHLDPFEFFTPGEEATEPEWVFEAAAERLREKLAAAAVGVPCADHVAALERACPPVSGHRTANSAGGGVGEPVELSPVELLHGVVGWQRVIGWAQAMQRQYVAALAQPDVIAPVEDLIEMAASPLGIALDIPDLPEHALLAEPVWARAVKAAAVKLAAVEIGCALAISPMTARKRAEDAVILTEQLPSVHRAQLVGAVDGYRASIIAERTVVLGPELRDRAAAAVLPVAAARAPGRLKALVDREVIRLDADAAARREVEARKGRGTRVLPDSDGMAAFIADLSATDALITQGVLDRIATAVTAAGLAAGRGQSQLRADAFVALFTDLAATGHFTITDSAAAPTAAERPVADGADAAPTAGPAPAEPTPPADHAPPGTAQVTQPRPAAVGEPARAPAKTAPATPASTGPDAAPARAPQRAPICVNVYITADALAGSNDEPAEIAGYGAITADLGRELATSAGAVRAITLGRGISRAGGAPPRSRPPRSRRPSSGPVPSLHGGAEPVDAGAEGGRRKGSSLTARRVGRPTAPATPSTNEPGDQSAPATPATATGHSDEPARSWACGTVLDVGRLRYRPPDRTADHVAVRDRICSFPTCATRAARCDIDHRQPFTDESGRDGGGATCPCNLDLLCRFHHLIKTFTGWTGSPAMSGTLTWTSPIGNTYPTEPGHLQLDSTAATVATATAAATSAGANEPPPF